MVEGDKRWTAILSTDLAGFTEMSQALGPERVYELLTAVLDLARAAIEDHGGHIVDTAGDGILAAFGAPQAHENASLSACRAALAFRNRLDSARAGLEARFDTQVRFRTAIASGNVLVARTQGNGIKVVGASVNKSARLCAQAHPDEIVISDTIRQDAEGYIETRARGTATLKGFDAPVPVHSLTGLTRTASNFDRARQRGLPQMVGRATELAECVTRLLSPGAAGTIAPRSPAGTILLRGPAGTILLRGAAGIGKSRLAHAITEAAGLRHYIGQCQSSGNARAYDPFIEIFRQASGAEWGADRAAALAPLFEKYPDLRAENAAIAAQDSTRDQTGRALKTRALYHRLLERIASETPTLFIIEDAHWIDPASLALMETLKQSGVRLLITARPEFAPPWLHGDALHRLELQPLEGADIARIARAAIARPITARVAQFIAEKSEGNPFVAEEIARALVQDQRLSDTPEGADLVGDPGTMLTVQLEQMVMSRVDRLAAEDRHTIQFAAALGRDFDAARLEAALGRPARLHRIARTPGLIEQIEPGHWRFVHALINHAVHDSLLSARRTAVHLAIAATIEAAGPVQGDQAADVAAHYLQSDRPERAAPHLVRAAAHSLDAYALYETDQHLTRAYALAETAPDLLDDATYTDMAVLWLRAMDNMGNFKRGLALSGQLMPRLAAQGYSPALSIARMLTTIALAHTWRYDEAHHLARTTLAEARSRNDHWGAAWAQVALMRILEETKRADILEIEDLARDAALVAEQTGDTQIAMMSQYLLSSAYRSSGMRRKALEQVDRIEAFSRSHGDRRAMGYAKWARALVHTIEGSPEKAAEAISDARTDVIQGSGDARVCLGIEYYCGTFLNPPGSFDAQIDALRAEVHTMGDRNIEGAMIFTSAVSAFQAGALARGWRKLAELERYIGPTGHVGMMHQVHALRCDVLLSMAGLIDPRDDAPPDRPVYPRKRPGLADLATFARLRPRALTLARRTIETSLALTPPASNPHNIRFVIARGLIARARKNTAPARSLLQQGRDMAETEGLELLAARARRALDAF